MRLAWFVVVVVASSCVQPAQPDGGPGTGGGGGGMVDPFADGGCVPSVPCVPQKVCHVGLSSCILISQCVDTGAFQPVGTPCGAGFTCQLDGECSGRLTLGVSSGANQHVFPFQAVPEPIVLRLTNQDGAPVAGERIELEIPAGLVVSPTGGVTDARGELGLQVKLGRSQLAPLVAKGPMNTRLTVPIAIDAIPEGMVFDLVGASRQEGHDGIGGLAPEARVGEVRGVLNEGQTFFADDCAVLAIDGPGFLRRVAGDGECGDSGDGALATAARVDRPTGLAKLGSKLYVADTRNHRVRVVDLDTGVIATFAGGGTAAGPGWGDGLDARQATLSSPGWLGVDPEREALLIADTGHDLLRRVEFSSGLISTVLRPTSCDAGVGFAGCGGELGCAFTWTLEAENRVPLPWTFTVSGRVCGQDVGGTVPGVLRIEENGYALGLVAGTTTPGTAPPLALRDLALIPLQASTRSFRSAVFAGGSTLWMVEPTTGLLTPSLGNGSSSSSGNYVAALDAGLGAATGLFLDYQTVFIADGPGHALRQVALPFSLPRQVQISTLGGSTERVVQMQPTVEPFKAGLTVDQASVVPPLEVDWIPSAVSQRAPCRPAERTTKTDGGVASVMARVGLFDCDLTAEFRRLHPPLRQGFGKRTTLLPYGHIATWVNERGTPTDGPLPELGALATISPPTSVEGPYFVTGCAVRVMDSDGFVWPFAGDPSRCGFGGDNGPALDASFARIGGLSSDSNALYVADTGNNRIRRIDRFTGVVTTIAGGGSGTPAADGDGAAATSAVLLRPEHVRVSAGELFIADNGHQRIRSVDLSTGVITNFLSSSSCNGRSIAFQGCVAPRSCALAGDALGLYVAGTICGSGPGGTTTGIVRAGIGLTHVAGRVGGATADGTVGTMLAVPGELALSFEQHLFFADPGTHRVRRLDRLSGQVQTVVGTGTAGFSGDYGPAAQATLSSPGGLSVQGSAMRIADTGNAAVRAVTW